MQLPLLHRSTQMAVLKKLIRRKARELQRRRRRAKLRLKKIRQFRWELLRLMQRLIDLRQRDAERGQREQARRSVSGMLQMYKRWLGNWTRSIKSQSRDIQQEEQLKRRLKRRLRLLRKRLRKHRKPKHLVDRSFKKLAKAVKRWQQRPDYRQFIEGLELIWAQEVEEVRRYLSDIREKSPKPRKAAHRTRGLHIDLPDFSSFWKSELQIKKIQHKKIQHSKTQEPREETQPEWRVYRVPKPSLRSPRKVENKPINSDIVFNLDDLDKDQKHRRRRIFNRKHSEKDTLGPSLKEMQKLFHFLKVYNPPEQRIGAAYGRNPKSNRNLKRKTAETDLYQELKETINDTEEIPPSKRRRVNRNQVDFILNRMRSIGSAITSEILKSRGLRSIKRANKHKWPAMTTFRRKIPIRHKYVDVDWGKSMKLPNSPSFKFVNKKNRKKIRALKKSQRRRELMENKNLWDSSDLSVSPSYLESQRKQKSKPVNKKNIKERKEKARTRRSLKENKKLWDSSDFLTPPSPKLVRKPKSKLIDMKNHRKESKKSGYSSDRSISPSQKLARMPKSKLVVDKNRKEIDVLKKDPRSRDSKDSQKSWDSFDRSTFPMQKLAKKPRPKVVDDKNIKEMGDLNKDQSGRDSKDSKRSWDSSDRSVSPEQKLAKKPKPEAVDDKNRDETEALNINKMKDHTRRDLKKRKKPLDSSEIPATGQVKNQKEIDSSDRSMSSLKKLAKKSKPKIVDDKNRIEMDSSDRSISPIPKLAKKPKHKIVYDKNKKNPEALNTNTKKESRHKDSMKKKKPLDSAEIPDQKIRKTTKLKKKVSHHPSESGTDDMVKKLINRKHLSETNLINQTGQRDSVTSLTESLKKFIMESGNGRKALRKSVLGWGLFPLTKKRKSQRSPHFMDSTYKNLRQSNSRSNDRMSVISRKSIRPSIRSSGTEPSMSEKSVSEKARSEKAVSENSVSEKAVSEMSVSIDSIESRIRSSNEGGNKVGFKADHQTKISNANETGRTIHYQTGKVEDQAINNTSPQARHSPDFTTGVLNYDQNIKIVSPIESKNDQDINPIVPKLGNVRFKSHNITIHKYKKKPTKRKTHYQINDQNTNKSTPDQNRSLDLDEPRYTRSINSDLLPPNHRTTISRSGTLTEADNVQGLKSEHQNSGYKENTTASSVSSKFNIRDFLESDLKHRSIHYFLRDVIESNYILDRSPDIEKLMKATENHYMWDNLTDLHTELVGGGINKLDVKRLLTDKYLAFLKTIQTAQISGPGPRLSDSESRRQSVIEQLNNLKFWYRHRLSNLPFRYGMQGLPNGSAKKAAEDGSMFQNLCVQELKAVRAKRDHWDERLRRLLPTTGTSASMSFVSWNTNCEVESEEEEELRTIDTRYSLTNLNKMLDEHKARFKAIEHQRLQEKALQGEVDSKIILMEKQSKCQLMESKKPSSQTSKKTEKRLLRPIDQLYYSPRKTCRVQKIIKLYSEYSEEEQHKEENEDQNVITEKCPKCGVKMQVPCYFPSSKTSSVILSSGSIEACAKNEFLVNTMADVCPRCGYIHDEAKPCSQPPEDRGKTTLLRLIKAVQAVRSTKCSESCSRQENDLRSCTSKLRQVETIAWRCPGELDEGGGDR